MRSCLGARNILVLEARRRFAMVLISRVTNGELSEHCLGDNANATIFYCNVNCDRDVAPETRKMFVSNVTRTAIYIHSRVASLTNIRQQFVKRESDL